MATAILAKKIVWLLGRMTAHSRHESPSKSAAAQEDSDAHLELTAYELEREEEEVGST
jgi:hypothetical protein